MAEFGNVFDLFKQAENKLSRQPEKSKQVKETEPPEGVKVYEATAEEIAYWHAFGGLCEVQDILRAHGMGYGSRQYDKLQTGYNEKNHEMTIALSANRYCKIPFTESDGEPLSEEKANSILTAVKKWSENH